MPLPCDPESVGLSFRVVFLALLGASSLRGHPFPEAQSPGHQAGSPAGLVQEAGWGVCQPGRAPRPLCLGLLWAPRSLGGLSLRAEGRAAGWESGAGQPILGDSRSWGAARPGGQLSSHSVRASFPDFRGHKRCGNRACSMLGDGGQREATPGCSHMAGTSREGRKWAARGRGVTEPPFLRCVENWVGGSRGGRVKESRRVACGPVVTPAEV